MLTGPGGAPDLQLAARTLAHNGTPEDLRWLVHTSGIPMDAVRPALRTLADNDPAEVRALALDPGRDGDLRRTAAAALANLGDASGLRVLYDLATDPNQPQGVRRLTVRSLCQSSDPAYLRGLAGQPPLHPAHRPAVAPAPPQPGGLGPARARSRD